MDFRYSAFAAALLCCLSCINIDNEVGGDMIPDSHQYTIVETQSIPLDVDMVPTDSLSGFSSSRFCIGSLRDPDLGISRRSCALTLVPLHEKIDFGKNPVVKYFHFTADQDTTSVADNGDHNILQSINVYEMKSPLNAKYDYDCNGDISAKVDFSKKINDRTIVVNGIDSLSFYFSKEFAEKYLSITDKDLKDIDTYTKKFPGIYMTSDDPAGNGGRFNFYSLQLGFDPDYYTITGNYAELAVNSIYEGKRKDTSFFFYFSPEKMIPGDDLFTNYSSGAFPQACLNLTSHDRLAETALLERSDDKLFFEGGGGLKPHISAVKLREDVRKKIADNGHDPDEAIINKASIILHYEAPDALFENMHLLPPVLSPTVRLHKDDTTQNKTTSKVLYYGLTDSSSSSENQGNIDSGKMRYCPDITFHLQEILRIKEGTDEWKALQEGERDLWMLSMAYETITTTSSSSSSELSDYYSMLAYQSYYQSMYGGYGGYGYGYGGYGYGDPYSNYYSYMMAAMYAGGSSTSTSTSLSLDKDRFYKIIFNGPACSDESLRPSFEFSYAVPKGK